MPQIKAIQTPPNKPHQTNSNNPCPILGDQVEESAHKQMEESAHKKGGLGK
jgi:hypothetical protein